MPSADWHDLSLSSWGLVEDSLVERFDSALAAAQRTKRGVSLVGRKSQAVALCKVLEEVSALYSWDTPALQSPVKMGRKAEQKLGNCVVVVTRLPSDWAKLGQFLGLPGPGKKKPTVREVVDSFISKRVQSQFTGDLDIAVHVLDTREGGQRGDVVQLFNRALKELRGGVLPLSSLSTLFTSQVSTDREGITLVSSSRSVESLPSSGVVQSHIAEVVVPSKILDKSYIQDKVRVGEKWVGVEYVKCGVDLSGLQSRGFLRNTFFKPGQKWRDSLTVWSDNEASNFGTILMYLQQSGGSAW